MGLRGWVGLDNRGFCEQASTKLLNMLRNRMRSMEERVLLAQYQNGKIHTSLFSPIFNFNSGFRSSLFRIQVFDAFLANGSRVQSPL
jgi:hypothetical protein